MSAFHPRPTMENPNKKKRSDDPVLSASRKKKMSVPDPDAIQIQSRTFIIEDDSADDLAGKALVSTLHDYMPNHTGQDVLPTKPKASVPAPKRLSKLEESFPSDDSLPRPSALDLPAGTETKTRPNSVTSVPHITMPGFNYQHGPRKSLKKESSHFVPPPPRPRLFSGAGLSDGIGSDAFSGVTTSEDRMGESGQETSDLESGADFKPKKGESIPQFVKVKPKVPIPPAPPAHVPTPAKPSVTKVPHEASKTQVQATHPHPHPVKPHPHVQPPVTKVPPQVPSKTKVEAVKPQVHPHVPPHAKFEAIHPHPPPHVVPHAQVPASFTSLPHNGKVPGDKSLPIHERLRRSYASETRVPSKLSDASKSSTLVLDASTIRLLSPVHSSSSSRSVSPTPKVEAASDHKPPRLAPVASIMSKDKFPSDFINPSVQSIYRRNPPEPAGAPSIVSKQSGSVVVRVPKHLPAGALAPIEEEDEEESSDESEEEGSGSEEESESGSEESEGKVQVASKSTLASKSHLTQYDVNSSQQVMVGPPKFDKVTRHKPESIREPRYGRVLKHIERGKTDFLTNNALAAIRIPPKIPIPRYVDDPKGKSHLWCPSGFARFYIYKPDYGRVPSYIKERLRAAKMKRKMAQGSDASMTSGWESSNTEIPAREGNVFLDPRFGGAKLYEPKKRDPCMNHEAYSWNDLMMRDGDPPVRRECHIRKC